MASNYPEMDEFVLGTVKKIMPYGAFISLDEYPGMEAFIHISQVSTGWVRNIREHLREGQKLVAKVSSVDVEKGQIDLSLKAVSEADRKRKLEAYQAEKKARKLVEIAGSKFKKLPAASWTEAGQPLLNAYGSLAVALEQLREGDNKAKLSQQWVAALKEIVEKEFKPKLVNLRSKLTLKFSSGNGVEKLRMALEAIEASGDKKASVKVHYLGAPNYFVDVESSDYKTALKALERTEAILGEYSAKQECEYSLEQEKK